MTDDDRRYCYDCEEETMHFPEPGTEYSVRWNCYMCEVVDDD